MKGILYETFALLLRVAVLVVAINSAVLHMIGEEISMKSVFSPLFIKEKIQFLVYSLITWIQSWT